MKRNKPFDSFQVRDLLEDVLRAPLPADVRSLHVNYRYMLAWGVSFAARNPAARILDFGCGDGTVVKAGRRLGLELSGTDVTGEGEHVRVIRDEAIPFESGSVDLMISNQVIEHVERLEATAREIARVLKNDGHFVCVFPTREVVREAHCGVPFLHWFPKGAAMRIPYAGLLSPVGFNFEKGKVPWRKWASDAVEYMDRFVFYRPRAEVLATFRRLFRVEPIDEHYLAFRFPRAAPFLRVPWAREGARSAWRRLNGAAFLCRKR